MSDEHVYPFPWRVMGVVALIVVAATVAAGLVMARNTVADEPVVAASPLSVVTPVEDQRQVTLLVQVRDRDRRATNNVLFGLGGKTGFVSELTLPPEVLLPTSPPTQLQDSSGPTGPISAQGQIEALLGVQVDAAIEMDRLAWAGLLDAVGSDDLAALGSSPATFPLVLDDILSRLPASERDAGQLLTSLGSMARLTVTNEDASHLLVLLGRSLRTMQVKRRALPVTAMRSGAVKVDSVRQPAAAAVVKRLFPKAQLQPGHSGMIRVVIERGGATLGAATAARLDLGEAGYGVVAQPDTEGASAEPVVYVAGSSDRDIALGVDVANVLGLPANSIVADLTPTAVVDVRVVLGSSYRATE